jgi:glycosyltransferase involved in cell wall biosynthesis
MIIAVNTKCNGKDESEENDNFIFEAFSRIARLQPLHTFILIFETFPRDSIIFPDNIVTTAIGPQTKNPAQWYIWYNIKIPAVLKKYKANVFVNYGGVGSLATKIPQCLILPDLSFVYFPALFQKGQLLFYKTFTLRSLKKSKVVITLSEFCKAEIIKKYKIDAAKIEVVYCGVNENIRQITADEREDIKEKYAGGNEYFIYAGEIGSHQNLLNLLKAFSAFKKRQKSNMQLLIAGKPAGKHEEFAENLRLFKFKEEVKILENLSPLEIINVISAAYTMVDSAVFEGSATHLLKAMKCGVPVITSSTSAMPEICADAALYTDPGNFKDIAVKMMTLFKDEKLRKELIDKGKIQAEKYSWDNTAGQLWKFIDNFEY